MGCNQIGDVGLVALCSVYPKKLTVLNLRFCRIEQHGVRCLAQTLASRPGCPLRRLYVDGNPGLGEHEARAALRSAVTRLPACQVFGLWHT